jgi:hypothetical protein
MGRLGDFFRALQKTGLFSLFLLPEYPPASWRDEWPEPQVPAGEARKEYLSKSVPEGAKSIMPRCLQRG